MTKRGRELTKIIFCKARTTVFDRGYVELIATPFRQHHSSTVWA
jgi:hypothetical protein